MKLTHILLIITIALTATSFLMHLTEQRDKHNLAISSCIYETAINEQFQGSHRQAWELFYNTCNIIVSGADYSSNGEWVNEGKIVGFSITEDSIITNTQ